MEIETGIWIAIITSGIALIVGLVQAIPAFRKVRMDSNTVNIESIKKLSDQVDELIDDKAKMNDRITWLEAELKRFTNGYARAMRFIQKHADVNVTIPDFLESDPDLKPRHERRK